jgi:hypothetical protein
MVFSTNAPSIHAPWNTDENVWYGRANSRSFRNLASSAPSPFVVPMHSSACIATLVIAAVVAEARPTFVQRIPNGASVPGVRALGHLNPNGGGQNNAFGEAFEAAGTQWTTAFCQADTDGDGATNGEELGDPCCTWRVGGAVSRGASHYQSASGSSGLWRRNADAAAGDSGNYHRDPQTDARTGEAFDACTDRRSSHTAQRPFRCDACGRGWCRVGGGRSVMKIPTTSSCPMGRQFRTLVSEYSSHC